nr:hypothetical protein [Tanacetum cinerariifolium]
MIENRSYLIDYKEIDGGFVAFGGNSKGGKITRKGKIRTDKLDFKDVYFVEELKFNLFSVSQICDKKNSVIFTNIVCVVLSPDFKLTDESHVLLKVPRKDNMYSVDLKNVVLQGGLTCLFAKATSDESTLWHRRLGHVNFKTINKLVKENLVRDALTKSMNYKPVVAGNQSNGSAGTQACDNEEVPRVNQENDANVNNTNNITTVSPTDKAASIEDNDVDENIVYGCVDDPNIPDLEEIGRFGDVEDDDSRGDMNNLDTYFQVSHVPTTRIHKDHPLDQIIGDVQSAIQTRNMSKNLEEHRFVTTVYQRTNYKDLQNCFFACFLSQEEPKKTLVDLPDGKRAIGTKWSFEKKDEKGIVIKNKARLVAQGYTQEEGIDYDEMDVNSAFLYGQIEKEVYICQPPGFEDPNFPDRVYKVENALYGLHQAPRAWYETLSTYLLDNGFQREKIDKTFFIKKDKNDILLVLVYVDDIIFGSTRKELCTEFEKIMHKKFKMSSMGELTLFLGLQVKQKEDGIFISQDKIFRYLKGQPKLGILYPKDSPFDLVTYTDSDYARASLDKKSTTGDFERIIDFLNANPIKYALTVNHTVYTSCIEQFWITAKAKNINGEAQIHAKVDGKKVIISKATIRRDLMFEDEGGVDCLSNEVIFEQLTLIGNMKRVGKEFSRKDTPIFPTMMVQAQANIGEERKLTRQDTEETYPSGPSDNVADEALNAENVSQHSNDSLHSGKDNIQLKELLEICTNLQNRVFDLENTKTAQAQEINSLKRGVKKLEKRKKSKTHGLRRLYKVGLSARVKSSSEESLGEEEAFKQGKNIADIDVDFEITLVDETAKDQGRIIVRDHKEPSESTTPTSIVDSTRPKAKGIVMEEPSEATTTTIPIPLKVQEKGKGIMVEEPLKMKKKDQISFDDQEAKRLQAELDQKQILTEEEAQKELKANIAMIELHDDKYFVDFRTELVEESLKKAEESSSKRAGDELEQESAKKQKVDDDQEAAELKKCLEIIPNDKDDVTIDATPLSSIEDLEVLWSIVKARFKKMYPLTNSTLTQMWNDVRLQVDYKVEMAYDLLRLVRRQLREGYVRE